MQSDMDYCSEEGLNDSAKNRLTPADVMQHRMDCLVSDLSLALDESQLPQYHRKRRGHKKRSKLIAALSLGINQNMLSEDSSSSVEELACSQDTKSSIPLTDSDDGSPIEEIRTRNLHLTHHRQMANMVESDSVNENISPLAPENRRKQKCKRLAFDTSIRPSTSVIRPFDRRGSLRRKKQLRCSPESERTIMLSGGKRKRGGIDFDFGKKGSANRKRSSDLYSALKIQNDDDLDEEMESQSDDSSEAGLYTCDEGREADDEQSDFFAEPGPSYGIPNGASSVGNIENEDSWWNPDNLQLSPVAKALFKERYEKMTKESQQACRLRFRKLRERLLRREIRAGKRRLHERKPEFSIISTINDRVARFLRDPLLSELRLMPICEREMDHLKHLADLYSFDVKTDGCQGTPVLSKTRKTITLLQFDMTAGRFSCGLSMPINERRKDQPSIMINNLTEGSNDSVESVITSGMNLRPPVPLVSWGDEDVADSLSERLADSEPEPVPSPSSLALHECTL